MALKAEEQQLLLGQLAANLKIHGYRRVEHSFSKPFPMGRISAHLNVANYESFFTLVLRVALRFDKVEELVNDLEDRLSQRERKRTQTISAEFGWLQGGGMKTWEVKSSEDVPRVAQEVADAITGAEVQGFFDRFSDLDQVFRVLVQDDSAVWRYSPIHHVRAIRALAIAWLAEGPDQAAEIRSLKHYALAELGDDFGMGELDTFASRLFSE